MNVFAIIIDAFAPMEEMGSSSQSFTLHIKAYGIIHFLSGAQKLPLFNCSPSPRLVLLQTSSHCIRGLLLKYKVYHTVSLHICGKLQYLPEDDHILLPKTCEQLS